MWREFPLAAEAFESSSGIPFLSLPNMGGIVREQEAEWNPLVMSELWDSGWLEIHRKEFQECKNHRNAILFMHVSKIRVVEHMPRLHPHTLVMFFASPVTGEIFFPVKTYFSSPHPRDPWSWLLIPSISCSVWGLWFIVVFPSSLSESGVMAWKLTAVCFM